MLTASLTTSARLEGQPSRALLGQVVNLATHHGPLTSSHHNRASAKLRAGQMSPRGLLAGLALTGLLLLLLAELAVTPGRASLRPPLPARWSRLAGMMRGMNRHDDLIGPERMSKLITCFLACQSCFDKEVCGRVLPFSTNDS
ncbi:unnamed protein product [Protopolystoma xenopodis]|uniref:Uncharacterized protein n=1 Tax=Protopolystoma xenopodis TaxID=117903 RepID=A0A448WNI4_9PLAT|nr:unnamed protein product [Protopolystoma xenopodis]